MKTPKDFEDDHICFVLGLVISVCCSTTIVVVAFAIWEMVK